MTILETLAEASLKLLAALAQVLGALGELFTTYWGPILWTAFFLWVVRWPDLRAELRKGAWVAVFLLYLFAALTWGLCAEPLYPALTEGLAAPWNDVLEKAVLLGIWVGVAFLCGAVQDAFSWAPPKVEIAGPPEGAAASDHGHGGHGHH